MSVSEHTRVRWLAMAGLLLVVNLVPDRAPADEPVVAGQDFIAVKNPKRLPARIPCKRIGMGVPGDYKPCITRLKSGELLVVAFAQRKKQDKLEEYFISFRSKDGGLTWGPRTEIKGISGREPFVTALKDGTLLMSSHILPQDANNVTGGKYWYSFIFRSTDEGHTWSTTVLGPENWPKKDSVATDRRAVQLPDGTVLMGVSTGTPNVRTAVWRSTDSGKTWRRLRDMGGYGQMYPQLLQLEDGRILYNFTIRGLAYPLGIQAVVNYDQGKTWDIETDRIIVESRTPKGKASGGGYGNTIQLPDGMLVTSYTYRGADGATHVEVVRWRLPAK